MFLITLEACRPHLNTQLWLLKLVLTCFCPGSPTAALNQRHEAGGEGPVWEVSSSGYTSPMGRFKLMNFKFKLLSVNLFHQNKIILSIFEKLWREYLVLSSNGLYTGTCINDEAIYIWSIHQLAFAGKLSIL